MKTFIPGDRIYALSDKIWSGRNGTVVMIEPDGKIIAHMDGCSETTFLPDDIALVDRPMTTSLVFDLLDFIREVSKQSPEKPDHWCKCGQCNRNADTARELLRRIEKPCLRCGFPMGLNEKCSTPYCS